jgi:hypothetical protein
MADANRTVLVGVPAGEMEGGKHQRDENAQARFVSTRTRLAIKRARDSAIREFMATDEEVEEGPLRSVFRKHRSQSIRAAVEAASKLESNFKGKAANPVSLAMIAAVHEFGNPEMGIPERSFLRGGIRHGMPKFKELNETNLRAVVLGKMTIEEAIDQLGVVAAGEVKREFAIGEFKALKQKTIDRKGSSRPLIDSGQLRQSITYVVEGKQSSGARII